MIKNYIKLAFKMMMRTKYYTFLTLAGSSFTIMIVCVCAGFIDLIVGANPPEPYRNRTLITQQFTIYKDGKSQITTPSRLFLQKHVQSLGSAEKVSIYGSGGFVSEINKKVRFHALKYTDTEFWKITDFEFLEGKPYNEGSVKNSRQVVVINESTREYLFNDSSALGKQISVKGKSFQIIGVVKDAPVMSSAYADAFAPITTDNIDPGKEKSLEGNYSAMILAKSSDDKNKIRSELRLRMIKLKNLDEGVDSVNLTAATTFEKFLTKSRGTNYQETKYGQTVGVMFTMMALFMLIPAISLINLNISRIGERAEEIGVRKAFGATSGALVGQLIVENIIITLIGGVIGLGLAIYASQMLVHVVNSFDPLFKMPVDSFIVSWRVFAFCIFSSLFFGLLSGVYPAWRMSRLNVIYALNGGKNL